MLLGGFYCVLVLCISPNEQTLVGEKEGERERCGSNMISVNEQPLIFCLAITIDITIQRRDMFGY